MALAVAGPVLDNQRFQNYYVYRHASDVLVKYMNIVCHQQVFSLTSDAFRVQQHLYYLANQAFLLNRDAYDALAMACCRQSIAIGASHDT